MLEKMGAFFDSRLDDYEEHQLNAIDSARIFYPFTARCLPMEQGARVLDLGCGTGLELGYYFDLNPSAQVTGIDLAEGMLKVLKEKFPLRKLTIIQGSYFDIPFGVDMYDAAVSVESLHHFTGEEKLALYQKVFHALTKGSCFILTDYFAASDAEEAFFQQELLRLKTEEGISDHEFYHYDTPLTAAHEIRVLREAGFSSVEVLATWAATGTIRAIK